MADTVDISLIMADMVDISLTMGGMVTDILMEDMEPLLTEVPMEITFLSDTETSIRTKLTKIPNPTKFLNLITPTLTIISTKLTTTTTLRTIIKATPSTSKSDGICKTADMTTSNRNTESTHKSHPVDPWVTMITVVTSAQDMEVMPTAVTENIITEEAMEATKKITTEEVTEAVQDTAVVHTAVTKNLEAVTMDRKMPNTTRRDNSGQRMKIKNEIEPSTRSFF